MDQNESDRPQLTGRALPFRPVQARQGYPEQARSGRETMEKKSRQDSRLPPFVADSFAKGGREQGSGKNWVVW